MANIPETSTYTAGIYQIETTDIVIGGIDGVINQQAQALANRTLYLNNIIASLEVDLTAAEAAITAAQTDIGAAQTSIATLQSEVTTLQTALANASSRLVGEVHNVPYTVTATNGLYTDTQGWLWYVPDGKSIGSTASVATIADNRLESLFKALWGTAAYTITGGKGASANADWTANRVLIIPDMRGRAVASSSATRAAGATYGTAQQTLNASQMPLHNHNVYVSNITATGIAGLSSSGLGIINNGSPTATSTILDVDGNRFFNGDAQGAIGDVGGGLPFDIIPPSKAYTELWFTGVKA